MPSGVKVAAAVGAGYLLGRTRKMRLAFMLAAAGVTGKFPARPSDLVIAGVKSLGSSDQVSELGEQLRGELLLAARAAAVAAATSQVDALNSRLQGVTSEVGADETLEDVGDAAEATPRRAAESLDPRRRSDNGDYDDEDLVDADDDVDEESDTLDEPSEEAPVRRRGTMRQSAAARAAARRSARASTHDEPRVRASRRRAAESGADAPVRRGR